MRFWWVNQNQTFRQEVGGGYLWSPKRSANGAKNYFYETMREVAPGDIVFSFADTFIKAIGIARSYCYECPKPAEFGTAGPNWNLIGWRVEVEWTRLIHEIRPKDHMELLRPHLPARYAPLQSTGDGLQGLYLTELPEIFAGVLGFLIGPEYEVKIDQIQTLDPGTLVLQNAAGIEAWEEHLQQEIVEDDHIQETERVSLVAARRGQGIFKQRVAKIETHCRITRVNNPAHLIASHCKPWRDSDNDERLDGENGLLLTPSIDHLFDRGFISFDDAGHVLISPVAHRPSLQRMGIKTDGAVNVGSFSSRQKHYLDFHRDSVFLKVKK